MGVILDGKLASAYFLDEIISRYNQVKLPDIKPNLAIVVLGDDPRSMTYINAKIRMCKRLGFDSTLLQLPLDTTQQLLREHIEVLNTDINISGIIVQLPLPKHIQVSALLDMISPAKDVDGFTPYNMGNLTLGNEAYISATPLGILMLMRYYKIQTQGKHIVVVGRSNIVGKPLSILLSQKRLLGDATVTLCHSNTKELAGITRQADIVIVAIGREKFLTKDMVKQDSIIIDVGINVVWSAEKQSNVLVGDVAFSELEAFVLAITPVPGGVGRMTIAGLMLNTFKAFSRQHSLAVDWNSSTLLF